MKQAVTILLLNDLHGYIEPHAELVRTGVGDRYRELGGLARIAAGFAEICRECVNVISAELCAMLAENLERSFAVYPYAQMSAYVKRCRGLVLYL